MARLKSRMAPTLVRYDSPGRVSQAEAAELSNCVPPLQAALAAAAKTQRKKQLWFTACIPSVRPMAPSLTSGGSGSYSGKDSPESPRSTMSDAPCHRLCSAEVCPLPPSEPAPSHSDLRSPASKPAPGSAGHPVPPAPSACGQKPMAPAAKTVPEIVPLSPGSKSPSGPQPSALDAIEDVASEVAISGARNKRDLHILFPKVKQLFLNGAATLRMKTAAWQGKRQTEVAANDGQAHGPEESEAEPQASSQGSVPERGMESCSVGDVFVDASPGGGEMSESHPAVRLGCEHQERVAPCSL